MARLILRKSWRLCGSVFILLYYFTNKKIALTVVIGALSFFLFLEVIRRISFEFNEKFFKIFRGFLVEKEKRGPLTTTYFLLSLSLIFLFFKKEIAILSGSFLVFGDIASVAVGSYFGRTKLIGRRSLEGTLSFFITCLIVGFLIIKLTLIKLPFNIVLWGALTASLAELIPFVDDNFSVGIVSALVMTMLSG